VFEHRPLESETEFLRTLDENPAMASTYVRLAMLYGSQGSFAEALEILDRGKQRDPLLPTLAASDVLVRCWQRDFDSAIALGRQGIALHPYLLAMRVNFAQALQFAGRPDEALVHYQIASTMSPDAPGVRALEGACHAVLGRPHAARATLAELEVLRRSQYIDAHYMVVLHNALGQRRKALEELERASIENSASLYMLDVSPRFDALRDDSAFLRLVRRTRAAS
jgi:tetratricopeptide (TPR) repeat protein